MIVNLQTHQLKSLAQIRDFVLGNDPVTFTLEDRAAANQWMASTLRKFGYTIQSKADKGLLRRYLAKVTGLSRAQIQRDIQQYVEKGTIEDRRKAPAKPFKTRYTKEDVLLLAKVDAIHDTLSGPATRKLCERMFTVFGDVQFERLAAISNGHLYNLRQTDSYLKVRRVMQKTRPTSVPIGVRRKPAPGGIPGFLRVDSVHQGDLDGIKGIYLINAVDEVTQFQCIMAVERISELFLIPILNQMIEFFPFRILGFHSDCGSEYINYRVAMMLDKLRIEQTRSRARHCNDNALAESKNASTVRKYLGYAHIPGHLADTVNTFTHTILSPYINYHRPCFFPTEEIDAKGKIRKRYPYDAMMTPYEKLKSVTQNKSYLKPGITMENLDAIALSQSDNEAGLELQKARKKLFQTIYKRSRSTAA
jgi:transposase InsO family protein